MSKAKLTFLPALEGIRGYAFLLVFFVHYTMLLVSDGTPTGESLKVLIVLSKATMPLFFALSGYLITSITFQTRERAGFFRVYYWRRALRVLPAYYICLAVSFLLAVLTATQMHWKELLLVVFLQNFSTTALGLGTKSPVVVGHLWSMAVEEQFYVLWPLAVWLLRRRVPLLILCYAGIVVVNVVRFQWPLHPFSPCLIYALLLTRADGILLGCALALHRQSERRWPWTAMAARAAVAVSIVILIVGRGVFVDRPLAQLTVRLLYPVLSVLGWALVVLALEDGWVARACSGGVARFFGRMSYGLYLFHMLCLAWFSPSVVSYLERWMPAPTAISLTCLAGLGLTTVVALASYRWLEIPMLGLRDRVRFGERQPRRLRVVAEVVPMRESTMTRLLRFQPQAASRIV